MTNKEWQLLLNTVHGEVPRRPVTGFIIDSPWLPGWAGFTPLQYYSSEESWFQANKKAIETFPGVLFLPGFWSEFGMCTEPSAFGAKMIWNELSLPHADSVMSDIAEVGKLKVPNPKTDGLLPFVIQRLRNYQCPIQEMGHQIKFAVSRGPLNIASFLVGTTELLTGFMMDTENSHRLLEIVTQFIVDWLQHQKEEFPSIEGMLILDDLVGFIGDEECREYAVPYLKRIFSAFDSKLNFFHNDAEGMVCAPYLKEIGVHLFNFSFKHSMKEIRQLAGPDVALMGNLPPRDVLASGTVQQIGEETRKMVREFGDKRRIIWSCGGGMPPNVPSENIWAFKKTIDEEVARI